MTRAFVVTAIEGHLDITTYTDTGPRFAGVMVSAANATGEHITFHRSLQDQPHVGDTVEFDEIPDGAITTKERA